MILGLALFLPGAQTSHVRAASVWASGAALVYYFRNATGEPLTASSKWLVASVALLVVNLLHGTTHWVAGIGQIVFQLCIAAPAFWMGRAVRSEQHLMRVVWVLFVASALSSALGILQVYYPATFLPREFSTLAQSLNRSGSLADLTDGGDHPGPGFMTCPVARRGWPDDDDLGLALAIRRGQRFIGRMSVGRGGRDDCVSAGPIALTLRWRVPRLLSAPVPPGTHPTGRSRWPAAPRS